MKRYHQFHGQQQPFKLMLGILAGSLAGWFFGLALCALWSQNPIIPDKTGFGLKNSLSYPSPLYSIGLVLWHSTLAFCGELNIQIRFHV